MTTYRSITTLSAMGSRDTRAVAPFTPAAGAACDEAERWSWPLPPSSLLAVLDDRRVLPDALEALAAAGVSPHATRVCSGLGGARDVRAAYARRGLWARLVSLLEDEDNVVTALEAVCGRDGAVLLVRVSRRRTGDARAALVCHGAPNVGLPSIARLWTI